MTNVGPLSGRFKSHPNYTDGVNLREPAVEETQLLSQLLAASGAPSFASSVFTDYMWSVDKLSHLRSEFRIPLKINVWPVDYRAMKVAAQEQTDEDIEECAYLAGNSLGLMPKKVGDAVVEELKVWGEKGVLGHTEHPGNRDWVTIDQGALATTAHLVGAEVAEVAVMGTLTANLHLLFTSFYKPTEKRNKILFEGNAFPSDAYAFASQLALHDYPPSSLITINPLPGEYTIRTSEILKLIEERGEQISIICFGAVQYYSGQWFDMQAITAAGHAKGCFVAWDCAHAIGNVPLKLHEWGVDFAVWCSYKYLNSGPGGIAGIFVHECHAEKRRLQGWWGHDLGTRFAMPPTFSPMAGAAGWQLSNPSVLNVMSLRTSLDLFATVSSYPPRKYLGGQQGSPSAPIMECLRDKSTLMTAYLEILLKSSRYYVPVEKIEETKEGQARFTIITPSDPQRRGCQLSLLFSPVESMDTIFTNLRQRGVVGDERRPGVIRLAPVPMYNSYRDCAMAYTALEESVREYIDLLYRDRKRAEQAEIMRRVQAAEDEEAAKQLAAGAQGGNGGENGASPSPSLAGALEPDLLDALATLRKPAMGRGGEPVKVGDSEIDG